MNLRPEACIHSTNKGFIGLEDSGKSTLVACMQSGLGAVRSGCRLNGTWLRLSCVCVCVWGFGPGI